MAFVATPGATVVDQTTLMKKYLQFVAALTDVNTPDETKLKMMQEVSENFENVTSSPQYSTFLEHIIPRFLTFLQDGEVQFLQEKPAQQLRKLVLEIIHRIPTNEHLRPHTKNVLSVMFRFLETENEENVLICLRIIIELHKQFRPPITQEIHHFLDFVKQIYKELPKVVNRYFENPQVIPENTVPPRSGRNDHNDRGEGQPRTRGQRDQNPLHHPERISVFESVGRTAHYCCVNVSALQGEYPQCCC